MPFKFVRINPEKYAQHLMELIKPDIESDIKNIIALASDFFLQKFSSTVKDWSNKPSFSIESEYVIDLPHGYINIIITPSIAGESAKVWIWHNVGTEPYTQPRNSPLFPVFGKHANYTKTGNIESRNKGKPTAFIFIPAGYKVGSSNKNPLNHNPNYAIEPRNFLKSISDSFNTEFELPDGKILSRTGFKKYINIGEIKKE